MFQKGNDFTRRDSLTMITDVGEKTSPYIALQYFIGVIARTLDSMNQ